MASRNQKPSSGSQMNVIGERRHQTLCQSLPQQARDFVNNYPHPRVPGLTDRLKSMFNNAFQNTENEVK